MVVFTSLDKKRLDNESKSTYIDRICSIRKEIDLTWKEVASLLNSELGLNYSESWYRKNFNQGSFKELSESCVTTESSDCNCDGECEICQNLDDCLEEWATELSKKESTVNEKLKELAMKKVEVSDLVTQNNAYIRRLSREETIKDIAKNYAKIMSESKPLLNVDTPFMTSDYTDAQGILLISDWHYGMVCDNPWNKFDPEICKDRISNLLEQVINAVLFYKLSHITILDLSDLIAGRIHTQIRIESRFDVITQTMDVSEILAEFLTELSKYCSVSFYSCLDNHSRLEPNKKESMDLESLTRIIPWYLADRLSCNDSIEICDNEYGADIITCKVLGHNIIAVHGDNDQPRTALERLSLMTHQHYDLLCTAHLHHFSADENHQTMIVSNASLMGVDRYAEKLRLTSDPSQTLIIATPNNVCEYIHRIVLK